MITSEQRKEIFTGLFFTSIPVSIMALLAMAAHSCDPISPEKRQSDLAEAFLKMDQTSLEMPARNLAEKWRGGAGDCAVVFNRGSAYITVEISSRGAGSHWEYFTVPAGLPINCEDADNVKEKLALDVSERNGAVTIVSGPLEESIKEKRQELKKEVVSYVQKALAGGYGIQEIKFSNRPLSR